MADSKENFINNGWEQRQALREQHLRSKRPKNYTSVIVICSILFIIGTCNACDSGNEREESKQIVTTNSDSSTTYDIQGNVVNKQQSEKVKIKSDNNTTGNNKTNITENKIIPTKYSILYQHVETKWNKYDYTYFYILISPVNLNNDDFKGGVKYILNEIYHKCGTKRFNAEFYDNRTAIINSIKEAKGISTALDVYKEIEIDVEMEKFLVAAYSGEVLHEVEPDCYYVYNLYFYPAINDDFPNSKAAKYWEQINYEPL